MKINRESIKLVNKLYGRKNIETKINGDFGYIDEISFINRPNYKKSSLYTCYTRYSRYKEEIWCELSCEAIKWGSHSFGIVTFNTFMFTFAYDFIYTLYDNDGRKHKYIATMYITPKIRRLTFEESNIL